ncbi:MAG: hypothetical protein WBA20_21100 [Ketobacter sp.]
MIPEANRIAYLEALGITQYVAHTAISGVLQLPVLEWDEVVPHAEEWSGLANNADNHDTQGEAFEGLSEIPAESAAEKTSVAIAPSKSHLETEGSAEHPPAVDTGIPELDLARLGLGAVQQKSSQASKVVSSVRPFSCVSVTLPGQFRVLLELAGADAPGLSALEHRMLSDLLGALGALNALDQFPAKLYRWPVINNPRMAADPVAAFDALSAFLATTEAVPKTLVMGSKAGVALGLVQSVNPQTLDRMPGQFGLVAGFAEMQSDWKLKAEAWARLREFLL